MVHLRCSLNNIKGIKYLPPTLEILKLSNCELGKNNIVLNNFYLPNLLILKINSNDELKILESVGGIILYAIEEYDP